MQIVYLFAFLAGLVLGVYAMIRGVERIGPRGRPPELDAMGRPIGTPRLTFTAPTTGAFATVFGVTGYLLSRYTTLSVGTQVTIALVAGVVGAIVGTAAVARWAKQAAKEDVVDERYLLQGHPAQVVSPIAASQTGEIAYLVGGKRYEVAAQSIDGTPVDVGTEVVIDRVENGIAYVEPWVQVEQRI